VAKDGKSKVATRNDDNEDDRGLHFDVSTGLKRVLGRELITHDEVAIFEMVKNSYDAGAKAVHIHFDDESVTVADNGSGMSYDDLQTKWLFVAYSAKRNGDAGSDFRDRAAARTHYAGSKGVGRFSTDRIGGTLVLQTRDSEANDGSVHKLTIDWDRFDKNHTEHFETIPVEYEKLTAFDLPTSLSKFGRTLKHGTVVRIVNLRRQWSRDVLLALKAALAKLINPFGPGIDTFSIFITAPHEERKDKEIAKAAAKVGDEPPSREIVNGPVGNFVFSDLQSRTTFIHVSIEDDFIYTSLTDRGELVYRIREPNKYANLERSGFTAEIYYLNHAAKITFARRVGLPSIQFGSVFLFRNGFRVYPIGEASDDWFGFDRRKQQGYSRYLGTREIIGRVDVYGSDSDFQEASSRNQGLIVTDAVRELRQAVMDHCLKRLEKYVVPVSWADKADAEAEDLSRLLTDAGRARVAAAIASLVDDANVELLDYSRRLVGLLNARSSEFETALESVRTIAEKVGDGALLGKLRKAEKRYSELRKSEAEARKIAERERVAAEEAAARAAAAEAAAENEQRRSHFLESFVNLDTATILNLHHQVTIYAVDIAQQIENVLAETAGQQTVPREVFLSALEQIAFLNRKVIAITKFAAKATFKLDSERIVTDLAAFITDYVSNIARVAGSARPRVEIQNNHSGIKIRFNPIDIAIVIDNLISNARRARASRIMFQVEPLGKSGLLMRVADNGIGLSPGVKPERIFEMGYTTTHGSGLGLYHVRQVLGEIGGSIEVLPGDGAAGITFAIKIVPTRKSR
jgi:signal transduction histidine kinase